MCKQVLLELDDLVQHGVRVVVGGLRPLSAAAAKTFWPTMTTDNGTNCRKVRDTQETSSTALRELIAEGRLTKARAANA